MMEEIVRINLDNEMDLVIAHKRIMKVGEFCGLGLPAQTTFATAVSEIARCAISEGEKSFMVISIGSTRVNRKELVASIFDSTDLLLSNSDALVYARRLLGDLPGFRSNGLYEIRLTHALPFSGTLSPAKLKSFKEYFRTEAPISPYDEIRRKNIQLIELSAKLQRSEEQYRALADTLPLMMFSVGRSGELIYANKWLKDYFPDTAVLRSARWHELIHPEDHKSIWEAWDTAFLNKQPFKSQGRLLDRSQNYVWHLLTIVPVLDKDGSVNNWIGFSVDIHSQKLVETTLKDNRELKEAKSELEKYHAQLQQKIRELNNSNQNLRQFAFIASHDLQEPLRKIKIFSHLLLKNLELNEKNQGYFNKVLDATERMSVLIRDVLYYSQVSNQNVPLEDVDLNLVAADVLADLEILIQEKNAKITVGDLPMVKGIPLQCWQLLSNLLLNALKFSVKQPLISLTAVTATESQKQLVKLTDPMADYYCISITDNGIGFDQWLAEKIFVIFQRLNDIESPGTGIGLALCKKIVENHGGAIAAVSEAGNGATFMVFLPAGPAARIYEEETYKITAATARESRD
jgi:PAS domain S-box-containing protein